MLIKKEEEIDEIKEAVDYITNIKIQAFITGVSDKPEETIQEKKEKTAKTEKNEEKEIEIEEGGEAIIKVKLTRENSQYPLRVQTLKTIKIKDAS